MSTRTLVGRRADDNYRKPFTTRRRIMAATYAGLALTASATIIPYIDRATSDSLAKHIRAGYPTYSRARIDSAITTYLIYLTVIGVLGAAGWLWSIHALRTDKVWTRWVATSLFAVGTSVAVTNLLMKDTSGETGLPTTLGWVGLLPCVPGLVAVTLLWRRP